MKNLLIFTLAIFSPLCGQAASDYGIIDFEKTTGIIKPVNSVGQPPYPGLDNDSLLHYLTEAGVKYSRLHDVGGSFAKNVFVDIPNIFRDFNADENDPASYDFTFTDLLLKNLVEAGVEPYYRLGVSIENNAAVKAYRIFPPSDYAKWARICEHIILHYNYGWADGYHFGISHWEIWNEPENFEDPLENQMWRGTFEQYMELYSVAAPYLKERFPDLMIGGYASTGFKAITKDYRNPVKDVARREYFLKCFHQFMGAARENGWPLDFFSFHSYSAVPYLNAQIQYVRKALDEYGFRNTQVSLNEWLPAPAKDKLGTARQAAEIAAGLIIFQNGPVDDAELYDGRVTGGTYAPLFQPETWHPRKAYYSLRMFGELRALGEVVALPELPEGIYGCAATDGNGRAAVMLSNLSGKTWKNNLLWPGFKVESVAIIDEDNDMNNTGIAKAKNLRPDSVALIRLVRK